MWHDLAVGDIAADMKLISSRMTRVHKVVFPAMWFGFLSLFFVLMITGQPGDSGRQPPPPVPFVIVPIVMAAFGFFFFRKLLWDLADEVFDGGDHLIVERSGVQARIELSNVQNVAWTTMVSPERVTLTLRQPTSLGREVVFSPPIRLSPFAVFSRSPIVDDLIERVEAARGFAR